MILKIVLSGFLFTFYLHKANSNIFIGGVSSSSSSLSKCTSVCEKTFPLTSNKIARSECCSRGCRFFGIAELVGATRQTELNISKEACHNFLCNSVILLMNAVLTNWSSLSLHLKTLGCFESYNGDSDREACNMGCDTMAKHQREVFGLSAEVSWSFFIEDGDGPQIVQAGELLEADDLLTDPALKHQLILDLTDENKLPEMRVKTLPVNTEDNGVRGDWWTDCTVRKVGMPRCLVASLLVLLILLVLWFGLSWDDKATLPSPPLFFNSDQAPPLPPKYSLLDDIKV